MLVSQLEYFRVVAKHEHISHAAEELRIAQPALSTTIGKLEKELGVPLFNRTGRNIELNDAGRRLLAHTDYLFGQMEELKKALEQTREILENEVTISVSNSMFLGSWLHGFVLDNPKIRLRQKMLSESQMLDALKEESIDVAIGEFNADVPGIVRKVLVEDEYVFSVAKPHPLASKKQVVFDDIRDADIISLPSNATYKIADRVFEQRGCVPKIIFEGSHRMMSKLELEGKGIVFATKQMMYMMMNAAMFQQLEEHNSYAVHTIHDMDCRSELCLCWKEGRKLPAMAQNFIEAMEATYPRYYQDKMFMDEAALLWNWKGDAE